MTAQPHAAAPPEGAETYRFLERRPRSAYKQLYLKGRNMTVGNLVYAMRANGQSPEEAAADRDLPLEQVVEAVRFYERHRDLVDGDAREDRRLLEAEGIAVDPPAVPR